MIMIDHDELAGWLQRTEKSMAEIARATGVSKRSLEYIRAGRSYKFGMTSKTMRALAPIYLQDTVGKADDAA